MSNGRPPLMTDTIFDEICDKIASSNLGIEVICKGFNISADTFWRAIKKNETYLNQYRSAKEFQAELLIDEIIDISDDSSRDTLINDKGAEIPDTEWISRSKLRVDSRKWLASHLLPKRYGNKVDVTTNGESVAVQNPVAVINFDGKKIELM